MSETAIIKLLIWQACFDPEPRVSQRTLARQLHVWPSYVCKVQKQAAKGLEALASGRRYTLADFEQARGVTGRMRERQPGASQPALLEPQPSNPYRAIAHARTLREWEQLERRGGGRVLFSVPIQH